MTSKQRMSLYRPVAGRVKLTYHDPYMGGTRARTFYSSGGYVFEDLPQGDRLIGAYLNPSNEACLRSTDEALEEVIRGAYNGLREKARREGFR